MPAESASLTLMAGLAGSILLIFDYYWSIYNPLNNSSYMKKFYIASLALTLMITVIDLKAHKVTLDYLYGLSLDFHSLKRRCNLYLFVFCY